MYANLSKEENHILTHNIRWGSDGYPIMKRGRKWYIDGMFGLGKFPTAFNTKNDASIYWEMYIDTLIDKTARKQS